METKSKNLDDLIFENRNRNYGAYAHRKNYSRYMMWALIAATTMFLTGISIPLIANFVIGNKGKERSVILVSDSLLVINDDTEVIEKPEPPKQKALDPVYTPPVVTMDSMAEQPDLLGLQEKAVNTPVGDTINIGGGGDTEVKETIVEQAPKETFLIVEEMPEFPGGDAGRSKFLKENTTYPRIARETGIQGTVYISFVVDEKGNVVELEMLRGIGGGCDEEALRVVGLMPNWKPGRQNGKEVRVKHSIPINFILI